MHIARKPPLADMRSLLSSAQLPVADLTPGHMEHFFGVWDDSGLNGVVGIELLGGDLALLRSLVVVASKRCSGVGSALLVRAEHYAAGKGARSIFLLTTTAEPYFEKHGYGALSREAAPDAIRNSAEFASLCPESAVLMMKHIS